MKVNDWVRVIDRSKTYNKHINNLGMIAQVEEVGDDYVEIYCLNGGVGAVDKDSVVVIDEPSYREKMRLGGFLKHGS